jgi:hypothetical protein
MKKVYIGIFCNVILMSGCKQILMWKYDITKPKTETHESILKFVKEYNQDLNQVFIFKDTSSYFSSMRDTVFKKNILSVLFFNENDFFIDYRKSGQCQWSGGAFLQKYSKDSTYSIDSAFRLSSLINKIIPIIPEEQLHDPVNYDLTVIEIWAKFIGKYNERLFCVSDVAKNRHDLKIRIVLLNMDMLKDWNLNKDQMLR